MSSSHSGEDGEGGVGGGDVDSPAERAVLAARERVHDAVVDLLDVLAERGDRLGLDDDAELAVVAERLAAQLSAPGLVGGAADVLDLLRIGLRAITGRARTS